MNDTAEGLRRGLLALSALGVVGTLVELSVLRHWQTASEPTPWPILILAGLMIQGVWLRPTRRRVSSARWIGLILALAGIYGLVVHVVANMATAPLDGTVGPIWDGLTVWGQVWMASTGGVGPAPPLSAASITPTGLARAPATHRHPAL